MIQTQNKWNVVLGQRYASTTMFIIFSPLERCLGLSRVKLISSHLQGGLTVHPTDRFKMDTLDDQAVLICKRAEKSDAGKYSVTLQNEKGQDSTSVNVVVFGTSAFWVCLFFFLFCNKTFGPFTLQLRLNLLSFGLGLGLGCSVYICDRKHAWRSKYSPG